MPPELFLSIRFIHWTCFIRFYKIATLVHKSTIDLKNIFYQRDLRFRGSLVKISLNTEVADFSIIDRLIFEMYSKNTQEVLHMQKIEDVA